jgi:pilus assembly protein CpaE
MHRDSIEVQMVTNLKIGIVSPNIGSVEHLRALLNGWDSSLRVTATAGGVEQVGRVADQEHPDVLLVEGTRHDQEELIALERVAPRYPNMAMIMLSANQSAEFLRHGMRIGLREILPLPVAKEALLEAVGRIQQRIALASAPKRKGKILSFIGCKGGSGATFLAANLAYAIAELEHKHVALIDLNCQFGDASLYVSERVPTTTLADISRQIHRLDAAFLASSMIQVLPNFAVLPAPEEPDQALHIRPEQIEALLWVAASHYDVVIVDVGRSLDDITVRALDQSERIFPVLQLTLPFVRDAKRLLHALTALGYGREKVKLLVNRYEKGGAIGVEDVAQTLRHDVFRTIPNSFSSVAASVNQGVPIIKLAGRDPVAKALRDMATAFTETNKGGSWLKSLLPTG